MLEMSLDAHPPLPVLFFYFLQQNTFISTIDYCKKKIRKSCRERRSGVKGIFFPSGEKGGGGHDKKFENTKALS